MEQLSQNNAVSANYKLWEGYSRYIYKLCLKKCKNQEDALEFYQEIYIKYHLHSENVAKHTRPGLWFKRVIDNAWFSKWRTQSRRIEFERLCEETVSYSAEQNTPDLRSLKEHTKHLGTLEQKMFEYVHRGFSFKELSHILGLSERGLKKRAHGALRLLERKNSI